MTYGVTLPINGKLYVEVEANSEEEAIEAALCSQDSTLDKVEDWGALRIVCQGNFFHGCCNEAYAEPIEE
jgi:hypothetical protein